MISGRFTTGQGSGLSYQTLIYILQIYWNSKLNKYFWFLTKLYTFSLIKLFSIMEIFCCKKKDYLWNIFLWTPHPENFSNSATGNNTFLRIFFIKTINVGNIIKRITLGKLCDVLFLVMLMMVKMFTILLNYNKLPKFINITQYYYVLLRKKVGHFLFKSVKYWFDKIFHHVYYKIKLLIYQLHKIFQFCTNYWEIIKINLLFIWRN